MGTTSDKLARIVATKTALADVITSNGGIAPDKFRDYPDALNTIINGDTNLSNSTINLSFESVNWKPETSFAPNVTVVSGSKILSRDIDYDVSYSNNDSIGTATVTVTGKGSYTGSKIANFAINACDLGNLPDGVFCNIELSKQVYQPEEQAEENGYYKPAITNVTLIDTTLSPEKTTTLISGTDYVYGYSNNTGPGFGKCTITGIGNYSGESFTQFQIISNNFTDIDSFVSLLEDGDFSNLKVGSTTITGTYVEDDTDYTTQESLMDAVDNGVLTPDSLQWTLIGIDTTPPEYVKYRRQGDDGNYEYCWTKPTVTTSGISNDGIETYTRGWDASIMKWNWVSTSKSITRINPIKKYYANNSAWSVSSTITDSDGNDWNFCGHTATFRTTYFITSRNEYKTTYGSIFWESSNPCLWLNTRFGSDELTYNGDHITSHGGFILRLYDSRMKFLKNVVNSVFLNFGKSSNLTTCNDRFYILSYYDVTSGGADSIFCYFSSNMQRKQYLADGSSISWYTRTPDVLNNTIKLVRKDGSLNLATTPSTAGSAVLPICTIG